MYKLSLVVTLFVLVSLSAVLVATRAEASAADAQSEALERLPLRRLTVELKQVSGDNVFRLLADVAETEITTDKCVADARVDLRMQNAPVRWVFAAVATQLDLRYGIRDGKVHVECAAVER